MNGATADDSVNTISAASKMRVRMMGVSHHFLRLLRKPQMGPILEFYAMS